LMEQRREAARQQLLETQPPAEEVVNVALLVRQLERAQSHLSFLWMAIMNTRADKALELGLPIEDGMLTDAELAQLATLDKRTLFLAPMRYFRPRNDAAGRIKWFMEMIEAAMRLATDQGDFEKEFRSLEVSDGRVKALDSIFSQAVRLNGGSARNLTLSEITLLNAHLLHTRARLQKQRADDGMNPEHVSPVLTTPTIEFGDSKTEYEGSETHMKSPPSTPKNEEEAEVISQTGEQKPLAIHSAPAHTVEGEETRSPSHRGSRRDRHRSSPSEKSTVVEGAVAQKSRDASTSPDIEDLKRMGLSSQPGGSTALFGASKPDSSPIMADATKTPTTEDRPLPHLSSGKMSAKERRNAKKRAKKAKKAQEAQEALDQANAATGGSSPPSAKGGEDPEFGTTSVIDINLEDEETDPSKGEDSQPSDSGSEDDEDTGEGDDPKGS
ncbi:MAG: hypothetical protein GY820_36320, partial [Gammaproteobacteria bacterium]|nr:hypothetical protein [Gammaproteobacteria bacterium]